MSSTTERKLAAIMFTDIVGYTAQMSKSEAKTLDLLEKKRSILNPLLKKHKGTFVKEIGDGTLTYFDSAINAASCAVKLQETTYDDKDMNIRAGIHIGDIVFKDGDVFGDGVNVASRLESIAPSGGVCESKNVYDELINQDDFDGIDLGLQSLKGVGRLIEVFGLKGEKLTQPNPDKYQENRIAKHSGDEVPSVAIIPFENKGKEEDVFYAYGISADLISDCSSAGLIRVSSLSDIEKLDYTNLDNTELSKKLFVRYVSQGVLWKREDMFQLSVELYDTKDKKVVWSDRWQEKWGNLPTIKGSLSDGLLKALDTKPKV
jgi:class 3 adenylate cyclase/TolB-like protein